MNKPQFAIDIDVIISLFVPYNFLNGFLWNFCQTVDTLQKVFTELIVCNINSVKLRLIMAIMLREHVEEELSKAT